MPTVGHSGVVTLSREDEIAAVRTALANVLGEGIGDLDAVASAVCTEFDRLGMAAHDAELNQAAATRAAGEYEPHT